MAVPERAPGPTVFLAAGEPSGDLHGAGLARALRRRLPGVRLLGLGGDLMEKEGVRLYAGLDDLAVMGFAEVLSRLPFFLKLRRTVFDALRQERVDLVIPIDYPGFNLRLARRAREDGIPVLYYIAPQVWAWHASRAAQLASDTDAVAVILPFEAAFLQRAGARAEFVGHPLMDAEPEMPPREEWLRALSADPDRPVLALFPGSRGQELQRHLGLFEETVRRVVENRPEVQPVLASAAGMAGRLGHLEWPRTTESRVLLRHATAALVKSGTTTLEAALAPTPFVVVYRMNPLSYQLARRLVKVPHIALANLVAGERVVPEFVQGEATPERLAAELLPLLDAGSDERRRMLDGLGRVRGVLGQGGAAERVAEIAAELLERPQ